MNFRHSCIIVTDLEKALWFYRDLLGLKIWIQKTLEGEFADKILGISNVKMTYVKMDFDDLETSTHPPRFELHYYHHPKCDIVYPSGHIAFTVKNIDELYNKLKKENIPFCSEPIVDLEKKTKLCFCEDFDGNVIELCEDL